MRRWNNIHVLYCIVLALSTRFALNSSVPRACREVWRMNDVRLEKAVELLSSLPIVHACDHSASEQLCFGPTQRPNSQRSSHWPPPAEPQCTDTRSRVRVATAPGGAT